VNYITLKQNKMFKITNKQSGFSQYMSKQDMQRFITHNNDYKYKVKRINEIDIEFIEEITYAVIGVISLSILITLFYFISL
tara:strand:- start:293 stop:535 length:243 start_codon:yes stop_codon:yes gene_type:complete